MRGHALQHRGRGGLEIHAIRQLHKLPGGHHGVLGVGSARHGVSDAIARLHFFDIRRRPLSTVPAPSLPKNDGRIGFVQAGAEIDVDEVDAGRRDLHQRLAGPGSGLGRSAYFRFSGPPGVSTKTAFIWCVISSGDGQ